MPKTDVSQQMNTEIRPQPELTGLTPGAVLPGAEIEIYGANLGPTKHSIPAVVIDQKSALVTMSRSNRIVCLVPQSAKSGEVVVRTIAGVSNPLHLHIARQLSSALHPVANPVVSRSGMIFATISGPRGKQTPVSVVRISQDGHTTPFVTEILNATGLAFNPDGELFVTSRAEGIVYRIDAVGESSVYAEGLGVATGAIFDPEGNLYVGDRSGTIFKIDPNRQIFVYATLEPSVSAYHLAWTKGGTLLVTGPTISSNDAIWAIDQDGSTRPWFQGLGRPQGLTLDADGNVFVTASYRGQRGVIRITPEGVAERVVAGYDLVGIAFSPHGSMVLATTDSVYDLEIAT